MITISDSKSRQNLAHCKALWDDVFADSDAYSEHYFTQHCKDNQILTLSEDSQPDAVLSMLHMNPYTLSVHGIPMPGYYIVGVATAPAWRHRGFMRNLLMEMFARCSRSQIPFVYLMPADDAIYQPFGFRTVCRQQIYHGSRDMFTDMLPFLSADETCRQNAVDFSNHWLSGRYRIFTHRNLSYYTTSALEMRACGGDLRIALSGGQIRSVIAYSDEKKLEIQDCCGDLPAGAEIFSPDERPKIMARVTDFCALARYMRADVPVDTTVRILDAHIPSNDACFHLTIDAYSGNAVRIETKTPEQTIDASEVFDKFFPACTWHIHEVV